MGLALLGHTPIAPFYDRPLHHLEVARRNVFAAERRLDYSSRPPGNEESLRQRGILGVYNPSVIGRMDLEKNALYKLDSHLHLPRQRFGTQSACRKQLEYITA